MRATPARRRPRPTSCPTTVPRRTPPESRGPLPCSTSRSSSRTAPAATPTATRSCWATRADLRRRSTRRPTRSRTCWSSRGIEPGDKVALSCPNLPAVPGRLLRHPQGRRGGRAAQRAAQGPRDRLPPRTTPRPRRTSASRAPPSCRWARRAAPASTHAASCEHFFLITADPAAASPIEGAETLARGPGRAAPTFETVVTEADRHRGHPLHQRHHRPAQGRRTDPRQHGAERADLQPAVRQPRDARRAPGRAAAVPLLRLRPCR